jgi:uncharacterized membrane protein YagU involved in acid resistance
MNRVLVGAIAGALATVPMTVFWETMHPRLAGEPPRPLPPREVAEGLAVKAGIHRDLSERDFQDAALLLHFAYGTVTGAMFGLLAPKRPAAGLATGMLFGVGVWAGSYLGWLPAFGVRQPIEYDPPTRTRLLIASHLVWGGSTGLIAAASLE